MKNRPDRALLDATIQLSSTLDLREALQTFVDASCTLTGAKMGALSVLDNWGETSLLISHGIPDEDLQRVDDAEWLHALLDQVPYKGSLILNDPRAELAEREITLPDPSPITNFMGRSLKIKGQVFGRLFLMDKVGGFGDADASIVRVLSRAAGAAIENADRYAESQNRERWIAASQELTTTMLEGADEEEALDLIAKTVREVSTSDTAVIVLPSVGDTWACEIADGWHADEMLGLVFPPQGRAMSVLHEGTGMIVDSLARAQTMRLPQFHQFGPALYAPLRARGETTGVLILLRRVGGEEFTASDLPLAESLASQATLALELASARHAEDVANLLDERARIARDLHDFAIQQLFAAGMRLDAARASTGADGSDPAKVSAALDDSLALVDEAVRQIRAIVHDLREPDQEVGVVERVRRETSLSRNVLGFAPSLLVSLDGHALNAVDDPDGEDVAIHEIDARIDPDIADDVVAVVREGLSNIARHAQATAASVSVDVGGFGTAGTVAITVADDGVGIDPDHQRTSGLGNLAARARRHGGTFDIGPGIDDAGSSIVWTAPLAL